LITLQDIKDSQSEQALAPLPADNKRSKNQTMRWAVACGGCGMVMALAVTHQGPGLTPDSTAYAQAARSLIAGEGFQHFNGSLVASPQTHFAPLFSVVLAAIMRAGTNFDHAARWLNAALFFVNCILFALLLARCVDGRHATAAAKLGGVLAALSPVLIHVHGMAWSEPLFLTCVLCGFLLIGTYIDGAGQAWLIGGAIAAALGFLTRYAGLAVVIGVAAALMERGPSSRNRARRVRDTAVFVMLSCAPMLGWFARNIAVSSHAADRTVAFHPPVSSDFYDAVVSLSDWILPTSDWPQTFGASRALCTVGAVVALIIAAAAFLTMMKHRDASRPSKRCGTVHILLWFAPLYLLFILASMTWFDASTELDFRILCPLYVALLPLIAAAFFVRVSRMEAPRWKKLRQLIVGVAVLLVAFECGRSVIWGNAIRRHGLGYSGYVWRRSALMDFVRKLPDDVLIYSNAPDALYLVADRLAKPIPKELLPGSRASAGTSVEMLGLMRHDLQKHHGYVIYFNTVDRDYLVSEERMLHNIRAKQMFAASDGAAFLERLPGAATALAPASSP
jgi:hypothetical protein